MVPGAVAAVVVKEKRIVRAFREAGAMGPDHPADPAALGVHEGQAFRILCRHRILRETGAGTYYLDLPAWQALESRRRRTALIAAAVAIVLAIVVYLLVPSR